MVQVRCTCNHLMNDDAQDGKYLSNHRQSMLPIINRKRTASKINRQLLTLASGQMEKMDQSSGGCGANGNDIVDNRLLATQLAATTWRSMMDDRSLTDNDQTDRKRSIKSGRSQHKSQQPNPTPAPTKSLLIPKLFLLSISLLLFSLSSLVPLASSNNTPPSAQTVEGKL